MPELLCKFFCRKRIYAFFRHIEKTYMCQKTQLNSCNKTFECLTSFRCTLVHTCILQYFIKDQTDFLMQNIHHIVFCDLIILRKETFCRSAWEASVSVARKSVPFTSASASSAISSFRRAGSTASPITSMRPMFSFLI